MQNQFTNSFMKLLPWIQTGGSRALGASLAVALALGFAATTRAESPQSEAVRAAFQEDVDAARREISFEAAESSAKLLTSDSPDWLGLSAEESLLQNQVAVSSDLYFSAQETEGDLQVALKRAVDRYINNYLKDDHASLLIRYDISFIEDHLVTEQFDEVWDVPQFEEHMVRRHALIEFDDAFRARLDSQWGEVMQTSKLLTTGLGAAGLLGLLGIAFGYLRLSTATRGRYAGRLRLLAGAAILALAAAGGLFANLNAAWLRWM